MMGSVIVNFMKISADTDLMPRSTLFAKVPFLEARCS